MTQELTLTRPDDWHLHVRDGAALNVVVPNAATHFARRRRRRDERRVGGRTDCRGLDDTI